MVGSGFSPRHYRLIFPVNPKLFFLSALALIEPLCAATVIQVSGFQTELVGSTKTVLASGDSTNFSDSVGVGQFAVFDMTKDGFDYADLRVTYQSDDGGVGSKVMIVRTVDSQGLTDAGTISVLITTTAPGGGTMGGGATLRFDWFTPGSFSAGAIQPGASLISDGIHYTTFDIDYLQYVTAELSNLESYFLHSSTEITADLTETPGLVRFEDNDGRSTFDRPEYAAQFLTKSGSSASHEVRVGKQAAPGNALFMFEFRDPSAVLSGFDPVQVSVVPEPANALGLLFLTVSGLLIRRRHLLS